MIGGIHIGRYYFDIIGSYVLCWKQCWVCDANGEECSVCGGLGYVEICPAEVEPRLLAAAQAEAQLRFDNQHQQALLIDRYGHYDPISIRDYWRVQE